MKRVKAAAYHGIENVKFAKRVAGAYSTDMIPMPYAKSLNPTSLIEAAEQTADNRVLFKIPNANGYEGEVGTTGMDPELEKAAGHAIEGANGLIAVNAVSYMRGALYYEFTERREDSTPYKVKAWMYNVEIGKGSLNHATDTKSVEFGEYKYPFTAYGDTLMDSAGTAPYRDEDGMERRAFIYTARPGDSGYADFDKAVPVPKVADDNAAPEA